MSIIIHFNTTSFIPSITLPSMHSYVSKTQKKLTMVPGIDETDQTVMTDDESSMVDIATSNTLYTHAIDLKSTNHVFGSYFGLPYQDHNYGAPPPPTPPNHSPCTSPAHANGIPDEDTNLSIVSASSNNEETQEGSITRCICGFAHDDEYMICCDHCLVWQHVDCMGLDRNNIPETYLCEKCEPRKVDRHKAKVLQTRKKVAMTDSSDSDEDRDIKNTERKQRSRKRKRKEREKNDEKSEHVHGRKRQMHKHSKERIEAKRSKLRRTKNKESTSTADEEAQDAWESSLEWCGKNFETAMSNQYTPEVQLLAKVLPKQGHEEKLMELLLTRNCKVIDGNQKKLICVYDIPRDQPLLEFKGKFLLASQFYDLHPAFSKRLFPYVMFYSVDDEDVCVDASVYGNEARFIRRSCKPNAELRHLVHNGNLHLYVSSTKAVFKDDEITLPLDFANLKEGIRDIECACESDDCLIKLHPKNGNVDMSHEKRRKGRKLFLSADDDDSSHSFHGNNLSPTKCKSVIKSHSQSSETTEGKYETEEQANERRKKTREERKLDAIMRAFDQMEKAAKRRQQALERQKAHHPKSEEILEKSESTTASKDDDKTTTASGSETQGCEEEKTLIPTPKPKKGKRRRGSGTAARRRTRTNSGGSDILSPEENMFPKSIPVSISDQISNHDLYVETSCSTTTSTTPIPSTTLSSCPLSPPVLKTKRLLLNEWLQEKSEIYTNPPTTTTTSVRTEVKWNTTAASSSTCYVQCTKDNPHSGGISAAHLRRSSTSSQIKPLPLKSCTEQGFTKKRWLRQAMVDCNSYDEPLTIDPGGLEGYAFDNCYLSPTSHGEIGSPGAVDDPITPLKKRRLLRESVESASSPLSPNVLSSEGIADASLNLSENLLTLETEVEEADQQLLLLKSDSSKFLSAVDEKSCEINDLKINQGSAEEAEIKEELSNNENDPCILFKPKCEISDEASDLKAASSNCKQMVSSIQISCDLENKTFDCIKTDNAKEDVSSSMPINYKVADNASYVVAASVHLCADKPMQSNCEIEIRNTDALDNIKIENDTKNHSAKLKVDSSDDNCTQCNSFEDNPSCSSNSAHSEVMNNTSMQDLDTFKKTSDADIRQIQPEIKLPKEEINNTLSEDNKIVSVTNERAKGNFTNLISTCPEDSSVIPVENTDISINVSLDYNNDTVHCADTFSKNALTSASTDDSKFLCGNSILSDDINVNNVKSSEVSNIDSNSSQLSSENSSLVSTACASATQKRKVSLSEYRLRMKDGFNKRINSENAKKNETTPATAIPETLPEKVTLAPLPLFNSAAISKSPPETPLKAPKLKKEVTECYIDIIEPRENLTERLKREFGFDDESEGIPPVFNSQCQSISTNTSAMPICAQPPPPPPSPPPPPPPPRPVKSSQINMKVVSATSSSQFSFSMPTSYATPSYIIPQVPSAPFISVHQTVNMPILSSVHPIPARGVQPTLLPSPHSFAPSLSGTVLQPSVQQEFSSINAQNYAALVQQALPPQLCKTYSHVCQQSLYK